METNVTGKYRNSGPTPTDEPTPINDSSHSSRIALNSTPSVPMAKGKTALVRFVSIAKRLIYCDFYIKSPYKRTFHTVLYLWLFYLVAASLMIMCILGIVGFSVCKNEDFTKTRPFDWDNPETLCHATLKALILAFAGVAVLNCFVLGISIATKKPCN